MRLLSALVLIYMLTFASNCKEEPDCVNFPDRQGLSVPFIFIDEVSGENLIWDFYSDNPKKIELDSLALFNYALERFPPTTAQWLPYNYGSRGYAVFIHVFDQSKVPNVDIYTPGSVTYYLYSGKSDYDTIVFDYHFQRKKHCYTVTNDTLNCFINGKPAGFSTKACFNCINDVFVIKK